MFSNSLNLIIIIFILLINNNYIKINKNQILLVLTILLFGSLLYNTNLIENLDTSKTDSTNTTPNDSDKTNKSETNQKIDTPAISDTKQITNTPTTSDTKQTTDTPVTSDTKQELDTPVTSDTKQIIDSPTTLDTKQIIDTPTTSDTKQELDTLSDIDSSSKHKYLHPRIGKTISSFEKMILQNNPKIKSKNLANNLNFYKKLKVVYEKDFTFLQKQLDSYGNLALTNLITTEYKITDQELIKTIDTKYKKRMVDIISYKLFNANSLTNYTNMLETMH